jgi:TPR repeat protein
MSVTEVLNTKDPTADKIAEAKARVMSGNESKVIAGIEILKRLADDERSGHAAAELGRIYDPYQGYNLPGLISDVVTAARWYSNAAKYNDQSAAAERENLRRKLEEQARSDRRDEAAKRALGYWR